MLLARFQSEIKYVDAVHLSDVGFEGYAKEMSIEAKDCIKLNDTIYRIYYCIYPKKNLEKMNLALHLNSSTSSPLLTLTKEDGNIAIRNTELFCSFSAESLILAWEKANPNNKEHGKLLKNVFDIFYTELTKKQDIAGYLNRFDEVVAKRFSDSKDASKESALDWIAETKRQQAKYIEHMKDKPDPLKEYFPFLQ